MKKILGIIVATFFGLIGLNSYANNSEHENIVVYHISEVVDGNVYSEPIGFIPNFSEEYTNEIRNKHKPENYDYINENIGEIAVIYFWNNNSIEAISFLAKKIAESFPGYKAFPSADIKTLDQALKHFPRNRK